MSEKIMEVLENMSEWELVEVWNAYCENNNYFEDMMHDMAFLDDYIGEIDSITDALNRVADGFETSGDYFKDTIYGIENADPDTDIDLDDLADYIERTQDALGNAELQDTLDEDEVED